MKKLCMFFESANTDTSIDIKKQQLEIIKKFNPMQDDFHTGIRQLSDIKTASEVWSDDYDENENFLYPDFTIQDAKKSLKTGKVTVYSSKKITQGTFVSPSKMMALDYSGGKQPFTKIVNISDVAWITSDEGQYAKI